MLGKTEDAAKYRAPLPKIKAAFNRAYVGADGRIKGNTQAVTCWPWRSIWWTAKGRGGRSYLVEDIEKRGNHLSTGFIGTKT